MIKYQQHTKWFKKLVKPLSYSDGLRELAHMIMDDGVIIVQQAIFHIVQPINIFC